MKIKAEEIRHGGISGMLSLPEPAIGIGLVMAHGAGGNARAAFLGNLAAALAGKGVEVLRIDLPFRQKHAGPPRPADAALDREGIAEAVAWMRPRVERVVAGGHSYGGRQTSILASEQPTLADALLFTSYPLHPPGKPEALRTDHWPKLSTPAFFVHGTKDPFGSIEELNTALRLLAARHELFVAEGQGHSLGKLDFIPELLRFLA